MLSGRQTSQLSKPLAVPKASACTTASFSLAWTIHHSCVLLPHNPLFILVMFLIRCSDACNSPDKPWAGCPSFHLCPGTSRHTDSQGCKAHYQLLIEGLQEGLPKACARNHCLHPQGWTMIYTLALNIKRPTLERNRNRSFTKKKKFWLPRRSA